MANILIVEDVEENIAEIKLCLEPRGHQLFIAHTVNSATTLLKAANFDLLICGVHLRRGVVFDLLKYVKSDPDKRSMPFVFFCCSPGAIAKYISTSMENTAMLLGADKYINHEHFNEQRFLSEINALLRTTTRPLEDRK
jgi:CheY-like chemotaxis protein